MFSGRSSNQRDRAPLGDRLRAAFLKPADPNLDIEEPLTPEELTAAVASANNKERLVGLLAAPWAAGIGLLITSALIANDPAASIHGKLNPRHVSVSLYHEVMLVLVVLSILMLVFSLLRKRLFLGIVTALYGLAVFNLHYWGFGIPFIMIAAWYLVRAYRLQKSLRLATGDNPWRPGQNRTDLPTRARPNKRYTPPR